MKKTSGSDFKKVIDIISIMPEYFESPLKAGLFAKAVKSGIIDIGIINPRDFSDNKHRKVDEKIYGGGAGRLLMAYPILKARDFVIKRYEEKYGKHLDNNPLTVIMSPGGKLLNSGLALELSRYSHIIIICGRYEGIDARVSELASALEVSIGDYILSGGEIASLVFIETISRFFENFMGNPLSLEEESFKDGVLEHHQYTVPRVVEGIPVPDELLSGNHKLINEWKKESSNKKTKENRPDLKIIKK